MLQFFLRNSKSQENYPQTPVAATIISYQKLNRDNPQMNLYSEKYFDADIITGSLCILIIFEISQTTIMITAVKLL